MGTGLSAIALSPFFVGCETPIPPQPINNGEDNNNNNSFPALPGFIKGLNLPWTYYGHDIGKHPDWSHDGFSNQYSKARLEQEFDYMKNLGVDLCRVFLFCDYRAGLDNQYVNEDMQALLDTSHHYKIRILPSLVDFNIQNTHPEFITTNRNNFLEDKIRPFIRNFGNNEAVYAWEVINEPRWATSIRKADMKSFISDCASLIKQETSKPVCFGAHDSGSFHDYDNAYCDLAQIHYWHSWNPLVTPTSSISNKPILIGETAPTNITFKLDSVLANGFKGLLFWRDEDYRFEPVENEFRNYQIAA